MKRPYYRRAPLSQRSLVLVSASLLIFGLLVVSGCGSADYETASYEDNAAYAPKSEMLDTSESMAGGEQSGGVVINTVKADRKIIYTATVRLVVEDYDAARKELRKLAGDVDAIVQSSDERVYSGENRMATFVYRVPVSEYEKFVQAAEKLGFHEGTNQNAQEVTAEYMDLKARIASQEILEKRVQKLADEREGEIEDVLKAEKELARIRGEIERFQGRLNQLENQTSLSTVTIELREEKDYEPPTAPSFGDRIAGSWAGSLENLTKTGENLVVGFVALAPWLMVLAVLGVVFLMFIYFLKLMFVRKRPSQGAAQS